MTTTPLTTSVKVPESLACGCVATARRDSTWRCSARPAAHSHALHFEADGLAAEEQRRGAGQAAVEGEVVGEVMAAQLQNPRRFRVGCAEHREEVIAAAPADGAFVEWDQPVVGEADFVEQFEATGRKRRCEDWRAAAAWFGSRSPSRNPCAARCPAAGWTSGWRCRSSVDVRAPRAAARRAGAAISRAPPRPRRPRPDRRRLGDRIRSRLVRRRMPESPDRRPANKQG